MSKLLKRECRSAFPFGIHLSIYVRKSYMDECQLLLFANFACFVEINIPYGSYMEGFGLSQLVKKIVKGFVRNVKKMMFQPFTPSI